MRILKQVVFILIFVFIMLQTSQAMGQFFFFRHPLEGEQAPDFSLKDLNGATLRMSEYRAGQPAIIFFWATWCPHCRIQLQELDKKKDELRQQGLSVILVDLQESALQVKDYLKRRNMNFEVFLDEDTDVAEQYQIFGIPVFFFVAPGGKVLAVKNVFPDDYMKIYQPAPPGISSALSAKEKAGIDE